MKPIDARKLLCPLLNKKCVADECMQWNVLIKRNDITEFSGFGYCEAVKKLDEYRKGFADGLVAYSTNEEGSQVVGNGKTTLSEALQNICDIWNYSPSNKNKT